MTEIRPIDANALREKVNNCFEDVFNDSVSHSSDFITFANFVDKLFDNAPTVCGNNPKWCESCVSKGKCANTRPKCDCEVCKALRVSYLHQDSITKSDTQI